jgi:hypothetical protein
MLKLAAYLLVFSAVAWVALILMTAGIIPWIY